MNKSTSTIKYLRQRLKSYTSRLFALVKLLLVAGFVALMLVVSHYNELREFVLSVLDEKTVMFVKNTAKLLYGSPSVLFALEQTAIIVAIPSIGVLLRSVCTYTFVSYIVCLLCCVVKTFSCENTSVLRVQPQCETHTQTSNKWLTLCKFIS